MAIILHSGSHTLEPDQPEHDVLSASLTAHHYLSATSVSLRFRFGKEILDETLKNPLLFQLFKFFSKIV
jgi:hypothetical protein